MPEAKTERVEFPSLHTPDPLTIPAILGLPETRAARAPAVVIAHGSAGPDSRGAFYARELNRSGIVTLELDMWSPRGLKGGLDRPKSIPDTLPDVFGAFSYLASWEDIDPARIGILGFSWGGVLAMLSATRPYSERCLGTGRRFAAHAPFYPVCWAYNVVPGLEFESFTGAPILLQCGELDAYDPPGAPEKLQREVDGIAPGLMRLKIHAGATHAFDRTEADMTVTDPFAHGGKGGQVLFAANPRAAAEARAATAAFFTDVFAR